MFFQSHTMTSFTVTLRDGPTVISSYQVESDKSANALLDDLNDAAYYNHTTELYDQWEFTVVAA